MKVVKGLAFFLFFAILFGSCFEAPEYPATPEISFESITYSTLAQGDSIAITINFKDGDGDLGLSEEDDSYDYRPVTYFQASSSGEFIEIPTEERIVRERSYKVLKPDPAAGKIISGRTRETNPLYSNLPEVTCENYESPQFLIQDTTFLDENPQIDSIFNLDGGTYYLVKQTIYFVSNPNHYNFEVDFLLKTGCSMGQKNCEEGGFQLLNWGEICTTFDGRFPVFNDGKNAMVGTLTYGMAAGKAGVGSFQELIGETPIKFRVMIRDRALHNSNVIESQARQLKEYN